MTTCRTLPAPSWAPRGKDRRLQWCPYRAADSYDDLDVVHEELPASTGGGLYIQVGDGSGLIIIDPRLEGPERRDALAHELVHHEQSAHSPRHHRIGRVREEDRVRRKTAARLVPTMHLQRFCDAQADLGHGVSPAEVMGEYEVTWQVACDALDNLTRWERPTGTA